jgi:NifU-like protein involved in Fe-S cluster formation
MNFEIFKKINDDKPNFREIEYPSVITEYKKDSCGDDYKLFLKIENDTITDISYKTTGCGFSVMALEALSHVGKNLTIDEAENINISKLEDFFILPERRKNYYESVINVLKKAICDFKNKI